MEMFRIGEVDLRSQETFTRGENTSRFISQRNPEFGEIIRGGIANQRHCRRM